MIVDNGYPEGLKPGDFIQTCDHFGDVFFEVVSCFADTTPRPYWSISSISYDKYGSTPKVKHINSTTKIRQILPVEMAIPIMMFHRQRFFSKDGQYDPFCGFVPVGKAMREKV